MPESFTAQVATATNPDFINKVQQAVVKIAVAVAAESASANPTTDAKRADLSYNALYDPQKYARLFSYGCASQGNTVASTDTTLENTVSALWNAYAGV